MLPIGAPRGEASHADGAAKAPRPVLKGREGVPLDIIPRAAPPLWPRSPLISQARRSHILPLVAPRARCYATIQASVLAPLSMHLYASVRLAGARSTESVPDPRVCLPARPLPHPGILDIPVPGP